jgi:hypothetical protein
LEIWQQEDQLFTIDSPDVASMKEHVASATSPAGNYEQLTPRSEGYYHTFQDRFRKEVEESSYLEELQKRRKAIPATQLAFWGWIPITNGTLDRSAVTLIAISEIKKEPSVPVIIENIPKHWNGQGVLNYEDFYPGSSAQLQLNSEFARSGRVIRKAQDLHSLPRLTSTTKSGFSKVAAGEQVTGILCFSGDLYLCWATVQGDSVVWEKLASLNLTTSDLSSVGRPRNLVKLPKVIELEKAPRFLSKRDLTL